MASALERFHHLLAEDPNGCWNWQGKLDAQGYGRFTASTGRTLQAHRWSYEHHIGDIPLGFEVDHLCGRPCCVNPLHLQAISADDHLQRTVERRTTCKAGHNYDDANTRIDGNGRRWCRTCDRERQRRHRGKGTTT